MIPYLYHTHVWGVSLVYCISVLVKPEVEVRAGNVRYTSYNITQDQQNVQFTCKVTSANPTTGITHSWLRDGQTLPGVEGQIYSITQVQKADRGMMTCTASNTEGTTTSSGVNIDVQCEYLSVQERS